MTEQLWTINDWDTIPTALHGVTIRLLTPEELELLPDGTEVLSVVGDRHVMGDGEFPEPNPDTRSGYTAWGVRQ